MDISKLAEQAALEEEGYALPIFEKSGEPVLGSDGEQATITITGNDSKRVQEAERAATRKAINRASRSKVTVEELYEGRIKLAAAAVIAWSGWEMDGQPWPCTPDNVKHLLHAPFILRQVEEGVSSHASFFATSSTD
jgi:hypothetical protein